LKLRNIIAVLAVPVVAACHSVGTTTAILYNEQGRYAKAAEVARGAVEQDPEDAEAHFQLGVACSHLDSVAAAYEHFMRSARLDGSAARRNLVENNVRHNFSKHYTNGQAEYARGNYAAALGHLERATQADPRRGVGFYNLGVTYARLAEAAPGFTDDAVRALTRAVEKSTADDDFHAAAMRALVKCSIATEDWAGAIAWGERCVAIDPGDGDVWRVLSTCHERQGNAERAKECLARAIAADPGAATEPQ
jgi:tetratricopeptide (TPR) repeat protein